MRKAPERGTQEKVSVDIEYASGLFGHFLQEYCFSIRVASIFQFLNPEGTYEPVETRSWFISAHIDSKDLVAFRHITYRTSDFATVERASQSGPIRNVESRILRI